MEYKFMIEDYSFGSIMINGKTYHSDVKIFPDHIVSPWWRKEGHTLNMEDIEDVLKAMPEIVIVGTGYSGFLRVDETLRKHIADQGILLILEKTGDAWKTFNKLSLNKRVVAAFHVTC